MMETNLMSLLKYIIDFQLIFLNIFCGNNKSKKLGFLNINLDFSISIFISTSYKRFNTCQTFK